MKIIYSNYFAIFISVLLLSSCKNDVNNPDYNPTNPDLAEVVPVPCDDPPLRKWLLKKYFSWGKDATLIATSPELTMDQLPLLHTLYFENNPSNQSFGPAGEYTQQINTGFKDLKRFWDLPDSGCIVLLATHGAMLQDRSKVLKMYKTNGETEAIANKYADSVANLFQIYPQLLNGNHPAFSFNQLATPDTTLAGIGQIPAKIIIGDGVLQGFESLGLGDIAPQAILAHEFGHHIQYDLGVLIRGMESGKELIPKTARRIELMADAYAAYYLAHPKGADISEDRLQRYKNVFSNLGDCLFEDNSHHGTPSQRIAAFEWGCKLVKEQKGKDQILPSVEVAKLFDAALENIVAN